MIVVDDRSWGPAMCMQYASSVTSCILSSLHSSPLCRGRPLPSLEEKVGRHRGRDHTISGLQLRLCTALNGGHCGLQESCRGGC